VRRRAEVWRQCGCKRAPCGGEVLSGGETQPRRGAAVRRRTVVSGGCSRRASESGGRAAERRMQAGTVRR
jgi:hypothetical protein